MPLFALIAVIALAGTPADRVFVGPVRTMDEADTVAGALAVSDGRIAWIGDADQTGPWIGAGTEVIPIEGVLLPGLHDTHVHLAAGGVELLEANLNRATTVDELLAEVRRHAEAHPEAKWLTGGGWDLARFDGVLDKAQLDAIAPDRPVSLWAADGHSAWVNSAALALARISAGTPDPVGGRIERDATGAPTGILRDEAMVPVEERIPPPSREQADAGLARALELAGSVGITTVFDPTVEPWSLAAYRRAERAGTLTVRVRGAVAIDPAEGARAVREPRRLARRYRSDGLRVDAAKLFLDGVIESGTATLLEPYLDGSAPQPPFTQAQLEAACQAVDRAGLQLHLHAICDGAVRQGLDALATLPPGQRRPVLVHLELIDPVDLPRFQALGALASFTALWAYPDPYVTELTLPVVGPERGARLYPIASLVEAGGTYVGGSDWSVSSMNPLDSIEVALTRRDPELDEGPVLAADQAVSGRTALLAYTRLGARATGTQATAARSPSGAERIW